MKRVSMRELAARLGVDRGTISRALSGDKDHLVAPATRERVREQAGLLGYRPDLMAATLRRGRSDTVGILGVLNDGVRGAPITPLIAETGERPGIARHLLRTFLSRRVDAIISLASMSDDVEALLDAATEVPVVLAVRDLPGAGLPSATCDDDAGGAMVAAHLKSRGHETVFQIQGPQGAATFSRRAAGFSRVCASEGLVEAPRDIVAPAAISLKGQDGIEAVLRAPVRPTAVFAHNDALAVGFIEAMRRNGLVYPDDIGVVGFNNFEISRVLAHPLTTIGYPVEDVSRHAGWLVKALIADRDCAWESVAFTPTLIDRGSAERAPPRRRGVAFGE